MLSPRTPVPEAVGLERSARILPRFAQKKPGCPFLGNQAFLLAAGMWSGFVFSLVYRFHQKMEMQKTSSCHFLAVFPCKIRK
jgi:hypothetical protein